MTRRTATATASRCGCVEGPGASATPARLARAQGCLLGPGRGRQPGRARRVRRPRRRSRRRHPDGPRRLVDGGRLEHPRRPAHRRLGDGARARPRRSWSEDGFEREAALEAYRDWLRSSPFDVGGTVGAALRDHPNPGEPGQRLADAGEPARRSTRTRSRRRARRRAGPPGQRASPTRTRCAGTRPPRSSWRWRHACARATGREARVARGRRVGREAPAPRRLVRRGARGGAARAARCATARARAG